jgi:hypothetical protein
MDSTALLTYAWHVMDAAHSNQKAAYSFHVANTRSSSIPIVPNIRIRHSG